MKCGDLVKLTKVGKLRYQVLWPNGSITSEGMTSIQYAG